VCHEEYSLPKRLDLCGRCRAGPVGLGSKRVIDIILATSAIILLAPLLTLCFLTCLLTSPGRAIFGHSGVGFRGKLFNCFKFRTMVLDSESRLRDHLRGKSKAAAEWAATRSFDLTRGDAIGVSPSQRPALDGMPQLFNRPDGRHEYRWSRRHEEELSGTLQCQWPICVPAWHYGPLASQRRSGTTYSKRVALLTRLCGANWSMASRCEDNDRHNPGAGSIRKTCIDRTAGARRSP